MKSEILILSILLFPIYCQQDKYRTNYGLYSNNYDSPNYGKFFHLLKRSKTRNELFIDVSTKAEGYNVKAAEVIQTNLGMHLPLHAIGNSSLYGTLIRDLVVDISFETNERIHVKVSIYKT